MTRSWAGRPLLTVAIPTRDRPDLLRRALGSVVGVTSPMPPPRDVQARVEVVVCDNASDPDDDRVREIAEELFDAWPGAGRYVRHAPSIGMVENLNACLSHASGEFVQILGHDDYLLPDGLCTVVDAVEISKQHVLLFGVNLVDPKQRVQRTQTFRRGSVLPPDRALRRVLRDSSFVRFPAIVVRRNAYEKVGAFDTTLGGPTDFEMWSRLFAHFSVELVPETAVAHTVQPDEAPGSTFTATAVRAILDIFDRVDRARILDASSLERCRADYLHQFLLGGAWRSLRAGDRAGAGRILDLFEMPELRALGASARWLAVRGAFELLTIGARPDRESADAEPSPGAEPERVSPGAD